jgi:two-component system response regulator (stage 0 sporulation protein F)
MIIRDLMVKLLIVDDDLQIADFLRTFFVDRGYNVFVAGDGDKALALVKKEKPHIVLLDIKIPNISGMEVLRQIRDIDKNIKVIMMTGVDDDAMMSLAKEYGAVDYITKPFSLHHLEDNVLPKILKQCI